MFWEAVWGAHFPTLHCKGAGNGWFGSRRPGSAALGLTSGGAGPPPIPKGTEVIPPAEGLVPQENGPRTLGKESLGEQRSPKRFS